MSYLALCLMMVFLVACFIASRLMNAGVVAIFTKTMASLGMVIGGILALSNGYAFYYLYIIIGLICGMLGDIFLELKKNYKNEDLTYFNSGTTAFALGHIMYLVGMIRMVDGAVSLWLESIISLVIAVAFASLLILVLSKPLKLNFGKCKWQSFGYCILLTFVTVFSIFIYVKARISICFKRFLKSNGCFFGSSMIEGLSPMHCASTPEFPDKKGHIISVFLRHFFCVRRGVRARTIVYSEKHTVIRSAKGEHLLAITVRCIKRNVDSSFG